MRYLTALTKLEFYHDCRLQYLQSTSLKVLQFSCNVSEACDIEAMIGSERDVPKLDMLDISIKLMRDPHHWGKDLHTVSSHKAWSRTKVKIEEISFHFSIEPSLLICLARRCRKDPWCLSIMEEGDKWCGQRDSRILSIPFLRQCKAKCLYLGSPNKVKRNSIIVIWLMHATLKPWDSVNWYYYRCFPEIAIKLQAVETLMSRISKLGTLKQIRFCIDAPVRETRGFLSACLEAFQEFRGLVKFEIESRNEILDLNRYDSIWCPLLVASIYHKFEWGHVIASQIAKYECLDLFIFRLDVLDVSDVQEPHYVLHVASAARCSFHGDLGSCQSSVNATSTLYACVVVFATSWQVLCSRIYSIKVLSAVADKVF